MQIWRADQHNVSIWNRLFDFGNINWNVFKLCLCRNTYYYYCRCESRTLSHTHTHCSIHCSTCVRCIGLWSLITTRYVYTEMRHSSPKIKQWRTFELIRYNNNNSHASSLRTYLIESILLTTRYAYKPYQWPQHRQCQQWQQFNISVASCTIAHTITNAYRQLLIIIIIICDLYCIISSRLTSCRM